jgi:hydrogenase maturation protease
MNVSAKGRPLIIGIGNPLRSDDGLGWAVAEQLAGNGEIDWDVLTVHQLTPELAQWVAAATLVVLIDASREGEPGELRMRSFSLSEQPVPLSTHHTTPEELVALTTTLYERCPPLVIISLTGADFSIGESLSPIVARSIPLVCAAARQCLLMTMQDQSSGRYDELLTVPEGHLCEHFVRAIRPVVTCLCCRKTMLDNRENSLCSPI